MLMLLTTPNDSESSTLTLYIYNILQNQLEFSQAQYTIICEISILLQYERFVGQIFNIYKMDSWLMNDAHITVYLLCITND